jgi:hypothetical protein
VADQSNELTLAELGAVAYNAAGWADGAEFGLDEANSDQWRRASAQALFAFGGASWGTLSAAGATAGLPAATCQDPTPPPDLSQVSVTSDQGSSMVAGTKVTFSAAGFQPGESVQAVLDGTELGVWLADDAGVVSFDWIVPEGTAVGQHTVVLTGLAAGHQASAAFTVADRLAQTGAAPGLLALLFLVSVCFIFGGGSLALTSVRERRGV